MAFANHHKAPPARKLPALYVLDSIVKNVGSPYTVYFGRNLYQTFMHAYSQVDTNVRRKLEEMLKTWREPVPGSLATNPVFPMGSTQTIVDNLNKLRASTAPQQRYPPQQGYPQARLPQATTYMHTPTPPPQHLAPTPVQNPQNYSPPTPVQYPQQYPGQHQQPQYPQYQQPQPQPQYQQPHSQPQLLDAYSATPVPPYRSPLPQVRAPTHDVDMQKLHMDIDDLTTDAKIECATHPMDQAAQNKLTTLQTLKEILDSGTASASDIVDIRNSIAQQMAKKIVERNHAPTHVSTMPSRPPFVPSPQLAHAAPPQFSQNAPQQQSSSTSSLLNTTNLAELLRATASHSNTPQPPSHPTTYGQTAPNGTTSQMSDGTQSTLGGELSLLAQLRASGILSANATPPQGLTPPQGYAVPGVVEVTFTSASIKMARPQLVKSFLTARPNQCSTCGRRFTSDDIGKEKKARHLDWHFKTKARMIEAERRGQNRSWYVDGREWIASREHDDDAPEDAATDVSPSAANKKKQADFVRAPSDSVLRSLPCPIDQEPFKSEWSEEVQDFIWKDAVLVGGRYYHASCYREVTKDRDKDGGGLTPLGAGMRTATPDSVLGKRKAEQEANGIKSKLKVEG